VLDNVIAMSFPHPVDDPDPKRKNHIDKIAAYLDETHKDKYVLYNLCEEKKYDNTLFHHGKLASCPIEDYSVPDLAVLLEVFPKIKAHLESADDAVVGIHCMGGRGRTGTFVSMLLIYLGLFKNAEDATKYFKSRRAPHDDEFRGVETDEQFRHVEYFARILQEFNGTIPFQTKNLKPKQIVIKDAAIKKAEQTWEIIFNRGKEKLYTKTVVDEKDFTVANGSTIVALNDFNSPLKNEITVEFYSYDKNNQDKSAKNGFKTYFHAGLLPVIGKKMETVNNNIWKDAGIEIKLVY